jgi:hypothetical protein
MEIEILDSAIDVQDPRDYIDSEVFGAITDELPRRVLHERAPIYNQGRTMFCTAYSATKGMNEVQ